MEEVKEAEPRGEALGEEAESVGDPQLTACVRNETMERKYCTFGWIKHSNLLRSMKVRKIRRK